jgi:hypothetical protein
MAGKYGARRSKLLKRDGNSCYWCSEPMDTGPSARRNPQSPWSCTIEHLRPRALGGCNHLPNLVLAHQKCNEKRDTDWDGITHCACEAWLAGDTHRFGIDTRPGKLESGGGINVHVTNVVQCAEPEDCAADHWYGIVARRVRSGRSVWYEGERNGKGSQEH